MRMLLTFGLVLGFDLPGGPVLTVTTSRANPDGSEHRRDLYLLGSHRQREAAEKGFWTAYFANSDENKAGGVMSRRRWWVHLMHCDAWHRKGPRPPAGGPVILGRDTLADASVVGPFVGPGHGPTL